MVYTIPQLRCVDNHWLFYVVTISLIPFLHSFSWFMTNRTQESSHLWFILLPICTFIFISLLDTTLNVLMLRVVGKPDIKEEKEVEEGGYSTATTSEEEESRRLSSSTMEGTKLASKKKRSRRVWTLERTLYKGVYYYYCLIHTIAFFASLYFIRHTSLSDIRFWLHVISLAIVSVNPGVAVAHELFHQTNRLENFLGKLLMSYKLYTHFAIQHVYCHHKDVGTEKDPNSARKGESLYHFVLRSSIGGYFKVWEIERNRLRDAKISFWNIRHNRMIRYNLFYIAAPLSIYLVLGFSSMMTFILQALISIFFIETVNFMEHYGLERQKLADDSFEPVSERHSWDGLYIVSNAVSLNLNYHSDHHKNPLKMYYQLKPNHISPLLPYPYTVMFLLATFPPLYRSVIHPIMDTYEKKHPAPTTTRSGSKQHG